MRLPWAETHPAKLCFTILVPTDHVVAAAIFFYGHMAFGTLLQTRGRAVGSKNYQAIILSIENFIINHPCY